MSSEVIINKSFYNKINNEKILGAIEHAMRDTCLKLEGACKTECPVDTGHLKRSHDKEITTGNNTVMGIIKVDESAKYWAYVNYGTSKQEANPYVTRAFEKVNPGTEVNQRFQAYYHPNE